jgi:hypothetical protein
MANSLSLTSDINRPRETIDTMQTECRFCGAQIDAAEAEKAAELMARVNQACSDASYLRIAAIAILVFLGMMLVPFLSWYGMWSFYFLIFAVPVMAVRWWVRFGFINADDSDFVRGRLTVAVISLLVLFPLIRVLASLFTGIFGHASR